MKNHLRPLTYGAIIGAIYLVIFTLIRFLITSTDSFIYVILGIPLAIYSYLYGMKYGLITLVVISIASFLIVNPYYVLLLVIPSLIFGLLLGIFKKKNINHLISYICLFLVSFIFDLLQFYLFLKILGQSVESFYSDVLILFKPFMEEEMLNTLGNILKATIPAVFVLYSLIKVLLNELIISFMIKRLRLGEVNKNKITLNYHPLIAIIYILFFIPNSIILNLYIKNQSNLFISIIFIILLTIFSIYSIYLFFIGSIYIMNYLKIKNGIVLVLITILLLLLFPITILFGIISNFINYKKIKITLNI